MAPQASGGEAKEIERTHPSDTLAHLG
jgi:hypothetical protein